MLTIHICGRVVSFTIYVYISSVFTRFHMFDINCGIRITCSIDVVYKFVYILVYIPKHSW